MPGIHFFTSEALFNELYKKLITCRMSLRQILRKKILIKSSAVYISVHAPEVQSYKATN